MFGLGIDDQRTLRVVPPTQLAIRGGRVVFITGPSGSGKSMLLDLIGDAIEQHPGVKPIRFDRMPALPDRPLVDGLGAAWPGLGLEATLKIMSRAGLGDAFVMLRKPRELSDGQRYRLGLAQVLAAVRTSNEPGLHVVACDEFCSTLDRVTASVLARQMRRWVDREPRVCFIAATAHDDLLEPLEPDVLIEKGLGACIEVITRDPSTQGSVAPMGVGDTNR